MDASCVARYLANHPVTVRIPHHTLRITHYASHIENSSMTLPAVAITLGAGIALVGYKVGTMKVLLCCAAAALVVSYSTTWI